MSRDLEEFLRMAAARRRMAQGAGVPPMIEPEVIEEVEEVVTATPVGRTIKPTIDTSAIQRHAASLGGDIKQAHQELQEDIHERFDHDVGKLDHSHEPTEVLDINDEPGTFARLFADPNSLRNAIILREILDRPDFD